MILNDPENRDPRDFYPTPPIGTSKLLGVEQFEGVIWEPACGAGDMAKVLIDSGYVVHASDLYDYGYGEVGCDFLKSGSVRNNVVTNPPFKFAEGFARKAISAATCKVALLCRLAWLEGERRGTFFDEFPPSRVWVFRKRLQMRRGRLPQKGDGASMLAMAWYVWDRSYAGPTVLGWI